MLGGVDPVEGYVEGEDHGQCAIEPGDDDDGPIPDSHNSLDEAPTRDGPIEDTHDPDGDQPGEGEHKQAEERLPGQPPKNGEPRLEHRHSDDHGGHEPQHRSEDVQDHEVENNEWRNRAAISSMCAATDDGVAFDTRRTSSAASKASR